MHFVNGTSLQFALSAQQCNSNEIIHLLPPSLFLSENTLIPSSWKLQNMPKQNSTDLKMAYCSNSGRNLNETHSDRWPLQKSNLISSSEPYFFSLQVKTAFSKQNNGSMLMKTVTWKQAICVSGHQSAKYANHWTPLNGVPLGCTSRVVGHSFFFTVHQLHWDPSFQPPFAHVTLFWRFFAQMTTYLLHFFTF